MEHEAENWPLIAFTTLAPLSVGASLGLIPGGMDHGLGTAIVLGIAVAALGASILHLGHPFRAVRALAEIRNSWLSREVALFGLFLMGLFLCTVLSIPGGPFTPSLPLQVATVLAGFAAIFATGMVYRLRSRPAWDHWTAVVAFPVSALAAGLPASFAIRFITQRAMAEDNSNWIFALAIAALFLAPIVTALRLGRLRQGAVEERESWVLASERYRSILVLRVIAPAVAVVLLFAGGPLAALACVAAALGELADRTLFFQAVVPVAMPGLASIAHPARTGAAHRVQSRG